MEERTTAEWLRLAGIALVLIGVLVGDIYLLTQDAHRAGVLEAGGLGAVVGIVIGPAFVGGSGFSAQTNASCRGLVVGCLLGGLLGGLLGQT